MRRILRPIAAAAACGRARREFVPAADLLSCSCKKVGKEHGPTSAPRPVDGVPCDARTWGHGAERTPFAMLTAFERPRRVRGGSRATARGPQVLRFSALHRANSRTAAHPGTALAMTHQAAHRGLLAVRYWAAAPMPVPRSAAVPGSVRQHALPTDSAQLFERSEQRERSEFWAGPAWRAPQGTRRRRAPASGPCSLPTFLHEQESRSAAGTTSRRAATHSTQAQHPSTPKHNPSKRSPLPQREPK